MERGRTMRWKPMLGMEGDASLSADMLLEEEEGVHGAEGRVWPLLHADTSGVNSAAQGFRLLLLPAAGSFVAACAAKSHPCQ